MVKENRDTLTELNMHSANGYKTDNNKLLRAFLWYQMIEIAFIIFFLFLCSLVTTGRIEEFAFMMLIGLTIGIVIQITIFILLGLICNLIGKRLWIMAKVAVYFCLDVIIPGLLFIPGFLLAGMKGANYDTLASKFFINTWFYLPILILISKVLFFKYYEKRFGPKTVQKNK